MVGAGAPKLRDVDATALRHLPYRVVLDVNLGVLLALHENTQSIADRRAGAGHGSVADHVAGNKRLVGPAAAVRAVREVDRVTVASGDGQIVDKSIIGAARSVRA